MNQRIVIILELLVAFGLFFWYVKPTYTMNIQTLRTEIASQKITVATMKKYSQQEKLLEQKQKSISPSNISRLLKILPTKNNTAHFLLNINSLALRSGFIISTFNIKNTEDNAQQDNIINSKQKLYKTFVLSISGVGTYGSFRQFLDGLERSLRLIDITALSIKANTQITVVGNNQQKINLYNYSLKLQIYRLPPAS